MRKLGLIFAAVLLLVLVTVFALRGQLRWWAAEMATTAINPAQEEDLFLPDCNGCNFILLSLDTLRDDRITPELMPNLSKIAARSLRFEKTYANAFFTTPSHMSVFTSLWPHQHQVMGADVHLPRDLHTAHEATPLAGNRETMAEALKEVGYQTIWSGPLNLKHLDFQLGFSRGFEKIISPLFSRPAKKLWNVPVNFDRLTFQSLVRSGKPPFFIFMHSYITHLPYGPDLESLLEKFLAGIKENPEAMFGPPQTKEGPWNEVMRAACSTRQTLPECFRKRFISEDRFLHAFGQFEMRELKNSNADPAVLKQAYDDSVRELDRQIGQFWQTMERLALLQNTVIFIFSDHGEELMEHGQLSHSSFHEHTARVPFIVVHPKIVQGQVSHKLASLIDILPTAFAVLGVPPAAGIMGQDLASKDHAKYVYGYSLGNDFITDGVWKLMRDYRGNEELFHLPSDPEEKRNLSGYWVPPVRTNEAALKKARHAAENTTPP